MLKRGSADITDVRHGSAQVMKVARGAALIWERVTSGLAIMGTPAATGAASAGTQSFALPSGIASSGETLLMIHSTSAGRTVSTPAGWTLIGAVNEVSGTGTQRMLHVFTKPATGSEGASVDVSISIASASSAVIARVRSLAAIAMGGEVGPSSSNTPNPGSFTSGFGAVATMWIAICSGRSSGGITAKPSGYDGFYAAVASNVAIGVAVRVATAASEDPGAFTMATSDSWSAAVLALR